MHIIEVLPLTHLPIIVPQILSYYFDAPLEKGAIVEISLNNRKVLAAVINSENINDKKILLKKSEFQIKKITKVISGKAQISEYQFKTAIWLSKTFFSPLGLCLKTILPPFFGKNKYPLERSATIKNSGHKEKPRVLLVSAKALLPQTEKRISQTIKEEQVLILVPDKVIAAELLTQLKKDFELDESAISFNGDTRPKEYYDLWQKIAAGKIRLVIGTRSALNLPFKNLGLIIVEDSNNEMYRSDMAPRYNASDLARFLSQLYGAKIIFANQGLSVNDTYEIEQGKLELEDKKTKTKTDTKIIDMVRELKKDNFSIFSQELKELMVGSIERGEKILIFSPRRGFSGLLICKNCGKSTKCPNCDKPLHVHKTTELILICHRCHHSQKPPAFCIHCNSGKLEPAGAIGTQKIFNDLTKMIEYGQLKKVPVVIIDTDIVKNETEAEELLDLMSKNKPAILIATQSILPYRFKYNFPTIGVINIDALTNFSDFQTEERALAQLNKILDFNPRDLIIQTYNPESKIANALLSNNYDNLIQEELKARKIFGYPPFKDIIKISYRHRYKDKTLLAARVLSERLHLARARLGLEQQITLNDSSTIFMFKDKGFFRYDMIIKSNKNLVEINEFLKYVPAGWQVEINPNNVF